MAPTSTALLPQYSAFWFRAISSSGLSTHIYYKFHKKSLLTKKGTAYFLTLIDSDSRCKHTIHATSFQSKVF
eukprot:c27037_g1_i1 orf=521-736(+)